MSENLPAQRTDDAITVWQLRQRGLTNSEIAAELAIPVSSVSTIIHEQLSMAVGEMQNASRAQLLALELARLDQMQAANWDTALAGDTRAGELCLKVMDRRSKLLGFDQTQTDETASVQTVVVAGTSENYIEALRSIASRQIVAGEDNGSQ